MADHSLSACVAEIKTNPGKFYVYILSKPDGTSFYVGVGDAKARREHRVSFHIRDSMRDRPRSRNLHKIHTIRKIISAGQEILHAIDSWHFWAMDARDREIALIKSIGRADLRRGPLTNLTNGGEGTVAPSAECRKISSDHMARLHLNQEFAAKRDAIIARVNSDQFLRAKTDAATRAANNIPSNKRRILKNLEKMNSAQGIIESTKRIQVLNADPAFNARCRETRSRTMRRLLADPEFENKRKAAIARTKGPGLSRKRSETALAFLAADPVRAAALAIKKSDAMRRRWQDPLYRAKVLSARGASRKSSGRLDGAR